MIALALCLAVQEPQGRTLEEWARDLSSLDAEAREEAHRRLREAGLEAREVLEEVYVRAGPEARARAEALLGRLALPVPVHGVALWLEQEPRQADVDPFTPPMFRLRIRNLGREPLRVAVSPEAPAGTPHLEWGPALLPTPTRLRVLERVEVVLALAGGESLWVRAQPYGWCPHAPMDRVRAWLVLGPEGSVPISNRLGGPESLQEGQIPAEVARRRGRPYDPGEFRSYRRGLTWYIDEQEFFWAWANWETVLQNDVRLSAAEGGGVLVEFVRPGSILEAGWLQTGDVITEVNRQRIEGPDEIPRLVEWLLSEQPEQVYIRINRAGHALVLVYRTVRIASADR